MIRIHIISQWGKLVIHLNIWIYTDRFVEICREVLVESLEGVYLHGSLAMNCFNPRGSDIDFIVIVNDKLTREQSKKLAAKALELHDSMPNQRGIEFSVILHTHLNPFIYPTPFEFHYSDYHREKYRTDHHYICGGFEDEDLASQLMVAYYRGTCLYGKPLEQICEPIPEKFYLKSIYHDVKTAEQDVIDNPVYVTLNLCRVLYYLKEGQVSSKREGGEWGVKALPDIYIELIARCLEGYNGIVDGIAVDQPTALDFVRYALDEIDAGMDI